MKSTQGMLERLREWYLNYFVKPRIIRQPKPTRAAIVNEVFQGGGEIPCTDLRFLKGNRPTIKVHNVSPFKQRDPEEEKVLNQLFVQGEEIPFDCK